MSAPATAHTFKPERLEVLFKKTENPERCM
jgi:hypothetical protein